MQKIKKAYTHSKFGFSSNLNSMNHPLFYLKYYLLSYETVNKKQIMRFRVQILFFFTRETTVQFLLLSMVTSPHGNLLLTYQEPSVCGRRCFVL